jgi:hypothetical protein
LRSGGVCAGAARNHVRRARSPASACVPKLGGAERPVRPAGRRSRSAGTGDHEGVERCVGTRSVAWAGARGPAAREAWRSFSCAPRLKTSRQRASGSWGFRRFTTETPRNTEGTRRGEVARYRAVTPRRQSALRAWRRFRAFCHSIVLHNLTPRSFDTTLGDALPRSATRATSGP